MEVGRTGIPSFRRRVLVPKRISTRASRVANRNRPDRSEGRFVAAFWSQNELPRGQAAWRNGIGAKTNFEMHVVPNDRDGLVLDDVESFLAEFMARILQYTDSNRPGPLCAQAG